MGFLFIDEIGAIEADRAEGWLRRPDGAPPLPPWLVIEAVGQLAGWIAMRRTDFGKRPVAALVGHIALSGIDALGDLRLEARIERLDARAILYSGSARCAAGEVVALARCVGPLLPMEKFDDPDAVRARFEALRSGAFPSHPGLVEADVVPAALSSVSIGAAAASCRLQIPVHARFFADHFPRRHVYPASLLADALNQLGLPLAAGALGVEPRRVQIARLLDYKLRSFSPPGQLMELGAEVVAYDGAIRVHAVAEGKRIARATLGYRVRPAS